jgi:hypothetical protein
MKIHSLVLFGLLIFNARLSLACLGGILQDSLSPYGLGDGQISGRYRHISISADKTYKFFYDLENSTWIAEEPEGTHDLQVESISSDGKTLTLLNSKTNGKIAIREIPGIATLIMVLKDNKVIKVTEVLSNVIPQRLPNGNIDPKAKVMRTRSFGPPKASVADPYSDPEINSEDRKTISCSGSENSQRNLDSVGSIGLDNR